MGFLGYILSVLFAITLIRDALDVKIHTWLVILNVVLALILIMLWVAQLKGVDLGFVGIFLSPVLAITFFINFVFTFGNGLMMTNLAFTILVSFLWFLQINGVEI